MIKRFCFRLVAKTVIWMALLCMAQVSLYAQTITSYTTNAIVQVGLTATLTVSSTNALTYQWLFGSTPVARATNSALSIPQAQLTNAGSYYIDVTDTNSNSSVTYGPALLDAYVGPQSTNVPAGGTLTLGTQVAGPLTLAYQWRFEGADIAQATDSTLTIPNMQITNVGYYTLACSIPAGTNQSTPATVGIIFPPNNPPGAIPAPPGLVDYWPLDGNFLDLMGTNNLTPRGSPAIVPGESGYACSFDGKNTYLLGQIAWVTPPWTASAWVNRLPGIFSSAAFLGDFWSSLKIEQYNKTLKVGATVFGTADYSFNYIMPTNVWTHLVFVGTTTNTSIYTNGVLQGTINNSLNLPRYQIGADIGGSVDTFHGTLDEIMLFNRVLAPAEILGIYNAGSAGVIRNPEFINPTNSDGQFATTIRGLTGKTISIYSSSNLLDWTLLNTLTNTTGLLPFVDPQTDASSTHFYKATQQ